MDLEIFLLIDSCSRGALIEIQNLVCMATRFTHFSNVPFFTTCVASRVTESAFTPLVMTTASIARACLSFVIILLWRKMIWLSVYFLARKTQWIFEKWFVRKNGVSYAWVMVRASWNVSGFLAIISSQMSRACRPWSICSISIRSKNNPRTRNKLRLV